MRGDQFICDKLVPMKMLRGFALLVTLVVASTPAAMACATPTVFVQELDKIEGALDAAMVRVESVPPKDVEFLERETKAAVHLGDRERFKAAMSNAYYPTFRFHKAHSEIAEELRAARAQQNNVRGRSLKLVSALSSFAELTDRFADYVASPRVGNQHVQTISFQLTVSRTLIARALTCDLWLMKEP